MFKVKEIKHIGRIADTGIKESAMIERRTGMPSKFKVPAVQISRRYWRI